VQRQWVCEGRADVGVVRRVDVRVRIGRRWDLDNILFADC
jgi:hypothetical protein